MSKDKEKKTHVQPTPPTSEDTHTTPDVTPEVPPPTLEEVQDKLQLILATNANSLVHNSIPITDSSQLPTVVRQYAVTVFNKQFGYDYDGKSTTPPDAISLVNLSAAEGISSFTDGNQDHVTDFMKETFNAQNVPDWIQDQACADLLDWTNNLVKLTTGNDWKHIALVQSYNPQDESKQHSIKTNTVLVFVNGSLTIDDVTANQTVVYYVGVYYEVITPLMAARQELRSDAYNKISSAKNTNKDDISLITASYSEKLFEKYFSYKWGGDPSDHPNGGPYLKVKAGELGSFEDGKTDGVDIFVKDTLLKEVSLPDWTSDTAISDVVNTFTGVITNTPYNGSWSSLSVDQTYHSNDVRNSLRVNAVVLYYLNSKTTGSGTTVKLSYIFWMGMFYEKPSLGTAVYDDMIQELFHNLQSTMSNISTENITPNKAGLITLLSRSASSTFKNKFGYDFKASSTTPSDSNGDKVYAVECFGEFKDVKESDVSAWTKDNIFKDNTFPFFTSIPDLGLKSQLDNKILWWLTQNTATTSGNRWGIDKYQHQNHPLDISKMIKTAAVAIYANGKLTGSGTTVKSTFLYYMGVYYLVDDHESDSDV